MTTQPLIAQKIALLREERCLTQEELATLAGLSTRFLQDLEAGRKSASITSVFKLSKAFGIIPQELLQEAWDDFLL